MVYERAAGRIAAERPGCGGAPPASFVRGLLHSVCMPTAKANPGDHYGVLEIGGMGESVGGGVTARFASVEEGLRAFGAPLDSPLRAAMIGGPLNPLRAMQALGNAVHIPTMRGILRALPEGSLPAGVEYAGAYVGPDKTAAAVQAEQPDMRYVFGSEKDTHTREACLKAWGGHGLPPSGSGAATACLLRAVGRSGSGAVAACLLAAWNRSGASGCGHGAVRTRTRKWRVDGASGPACPLVRARIDQRPRNRRGSANPGGKAGALPMPAGPGGADRALGVVQHRGSPRSAM